MDVRMMNRSPGRRALTRFTTIAVALALTVVGLVVVQPVQPAQALSGSDFQPGYIIDDSQFYDANGMTQAQIQAFLESKEPGTCGNSLCLKNYRESTDAHAAIKSTSTGNTRCGAYPGGTNDLASTIIFKAQQACGISAKVILVTLQKEQALITNLTPSAPAMQRAMGYACSDTAPCAVDSLGFGKQVYKAALQFNTYKAAKYLGQPGLQTIAYAPPYLDNGVLKDCPSVTVNVLNYATAALYNYTPYTPNAAALANLTGSAPPCGSYGNRNFWVFYNNWFGSPVGNPSGALQSTTVGNNTVTVSGWAVDADVQSAAISVRITSNAGWTQVVTANTSNSASQATFPVAGTNHGFSATIHASVGSQQLCAYAVNQGLGADVGIGCASVSVPTSLTSTRIQGTDRYDTAVQVSKKTAPGVPVVYVASGENYPDALSVAPAAAKQGVPLLLVTGASVPTAVRAELTRLQPQRIVAVGGVAAMSDAVVADLNTIAPTTRISGTDRYNTSIEVGRVLGADRSGKVYLAAGSNFPDALSSASSAGFKDAPLLLVDGTAASASAALVAALQSWGVTTVTIIGGTSVVTDQFLGSVRGVPGVTAVNRLAGVDRYSTSIAVNAATYPHPTAAFMAAGTAFPDGLSGGALAGKLGVPMFLIPGQCVPNGALDQLIAAAPMTVTALGGTTVLTAAAQAFAPC